MQEAVSLGIQPRNITVQGSAECKPAALRMYELSKHTYSAVRMGTTARQHKN